MRKPIPEKAEKVLEKGSRTEGGEGKASPAATVALTLPKRLQLASHGPGASLTSFLLPTPAPVPMSGKEGGWGRTWAISGQVWVEWELRSSPEGCTTGCRFQTDWLGERVYVKQRPLGVGKGMAENNCLAEREGGGARKVDGAGLEVSAPMKGGIKELRVTCAGRVI